MKAWESKNAKNAAKAGGISLMALSLAACGGSDSSVTQAQLDAQTAAATAAAAAQAAAEADAATAEAAQAVAEAAQAAAEAAQAAAEAAQAAAEAEAAAVSTSVVSSLTTGNDVLTGNAGNDSFSGTTATDAAGDVIVDTSTTDNDTLTMTLTADLPALIVTNVENVVLNTSALVGVDLDVANITNATTTVNLTAVGNNGQATVDNASASNTIVAGTGVTTLIIDTAADGATVTSGAETTRMDVSSSAAAQGLTINTAAALVDVNNIAGGGAIVGDLTINFAADTDIVLDAIGDSLVISGADGSISAASSVFTAETVTNNSTGTFSIDVDVDGAHDLTSVSAARFDMTYDSNGGAVTMANTGVNLQVDETFGIATTITGTAASEATNSITGVVSTAALTNFNFANYRTVNLSADEDTTITSLSIEATNNLLLSGANDITLATDVTALSVDGSAMTGALDATFNNAMATATGGAGADTLDFTSGTSTTVVATGNAGNDTITFLAGAATSVTVNGGAGNDNLSVDTTQATIVYDGGNGNDTLTLAAGNYTAAAVTLTGVEILSATGNVELDSSVLTGETVVLSNNAAGRYDISVDGNNLDASNFVSDSAQGITNNVDDIAGISLTITGTAFADILLGDNVADAIVGGAGADTVDGEGGADTITAGEGADGVIAEGGDTINLTETTSAGDNVIIQAVTAGSAVGAAGATWTGFNVITGFTSTTDDIVFDDGTTAANIFTDTVAALDKIIGLGAATGNVTIYAGTVATGTDNDLAAADADDVDSVLAFLNAAGVAHDSAANGDIDVIAITFTDQTALYSFTDVATGNDVEVGELRYLASVDEVLVAGDIII
ncbi:calcium-binding protein [Planktomarina temperata]|nr:calcium-binding protein [Planktomarina temperata]